MSIPVYLTLMAVVSWDLYFFLSYVARLLTDAIQTRDWKPPVTVLIPAYNEENNIRRAVESVLNSGYDRLNIVVIDDGSSDGTYEMALKTSMEDKVMVIRIEHSGKAKALNEGLKLAEGEVVVTIDADCILKQGAINALVRRFYSDEVVAVGGQVRVQVKSPLSLVQDIEHLRIAMFRRARELDNLSLAPGPLSAFRKRSLIDAVGFQDNVVEDYATTMNLKKLGRVVYSPEAVVWTHMHSSLRKLWRQRVRWTVGNLKNLKSETLKRKLSLVIGDTIALLDVILPFVLFKYSLPLLVVWIIFEIVTMLVPAVIEGTPPKHGWVEVLSFPAVLWFWAAFYFILHVYCYLRFYILKKRDVEWI